ncbi:hypothetical protein L7F22_018247 [Adiantum nelumboides]|nr:hypothetical protein [Adiantum nelumboides]
MVLIRTTGLKLEMHEKRLRMETRQFLEVFKGFCPKRVRHAFDTDQRFGLLSLLVFLVSPLGYMHAEHLVKSFKHSGKGRKHWNEHVALRLQSSCDEVMYAYMATVEDMIYFDTCDASKKKIAWSIKSFKKAIIQPLVEMREAKLENSLLKTHVQEQEEQNWFLKEALVKLYGNGDLTKEEVYTVQKIASGS